MSEGTELALRAALNVLRASIETGRVSSDIAPDPTARADTAVRPTRLLEGAERPARCGSGRPRYVQDRGERGARSARPL